MADTKKLNKNEVVLQVLVEIEKKTGRLDPKDVVKEAESITSPLHKYFEWDDSVAAEAFRLWQARHLINHVKIEIMGKEAPAYWSAKINTNDVEVQGYYSTKRVLSEKEILLQVMQSAIEEIKYWQKKYKTIKDLAEIVNNDKIEEVVKKNHIE